MELSCPISAERVNESVVRIVAFMVAMIAICCIAFSNYWAISLLAVDFAARAFGNGKFSLLKLIAVNISKALHLKPTMTDLAPKKFAATMGFAFCLLITATFLFSFSTATLILISIMVMFALLESLFGVCVGCYVYTFLQVFKRKKA
ncbi:DUF4395 domain-containing protein [Pedobacter sp. Leaf194]|uniref:DUF4395 domain-containing protein n=1 Tax=Pedobacter sp. Leaf194 TaxID=1736297 RepID=UPI0007038E4C|nr:DUF4395 domain-containing protein [Pedobacter sp. Leaf194]KQS35868.1 hypothetical protein ASG14_10430 [Pedobacter sp. Leaf194]